MISGLNLSDDFLNGIPFSNLACRRYSQQRQGLDTSIYKTFGPGAEVRILMAPRQHCVAYHFKDDSLLFCGDTLFVMGCGRLFEGTAEQLWHSLQRLKALPVDTLIYCTHEYTQNNGHFALTVEPDNQALQDKIRRAAALRANNQPTVPSTLAEELATNPFLREDSSSLRKTLGLLDSTPVEIFAKVRQLKDRF